MSKKYPFSLKALAFGVFIGFSLITPAKAGLNEALNEMFLSNVTSPSAYESQTRGGFVMGSIAARAPIRQVNVVAFDPPRINAGCGGIDMFGGSFSFINADQLVTLFRTVATNAVGALFYMGIQKIQPDLANLMSKFQSLVHALNLGNKNTCAIANSLVKMAFDPASQATKAAQDAAGSKSVTSAANDIFDAVKGIFENKGKTQPEGTVAGNVVDTPSYGNLTWRALVNSKQAVTIGSIFGGTNADQLRTLEIIQSITGTLITKDGAGANDKGKSELKLPTIASVKIFVEGIPEGQKQTILGCPAGAETNRQGCNTITNKIIDHSNWKGVKGVVNELLLGDSTGQSITANSLAYKIVNCGSGSSGANVCGFTAQQKSFVEQTKIPVIYFLRKSQKNSALAYSVSTLMVPLITSELTINYMDALVQTIMGAFNNAGEVQMPDVVQDSLKSIRQELATASKDMADQMVRLKQADDLVNLLVTNNTNLVAYGTR